MTSSRSVKQAERLFHVRAQSLAVGEQARAF